MWLWGEKLIIGLIKLIECFQPCRLPTLSLEWEYVELRNEGMQRKKIAASVY